MTTPSPEEHQRIHALWQAKLAVDPWNGWRALLAGWKIEGTTCPISDGEPFTGYYRSKTADRKNFAPVAYWYDNEGELKCLFGGKALDPDRARDLWAFAAPHPISHRLYVDVAENGMPWPDLDERVTPQALSISGEKPPVAGAGHNNPPETSELEELKNKIENAKGGVADYAKITSDEQAARARSLKNRLTELAGDVDKLRKIKKQPHLDAEREVDAEHMPVVNDAKDAAKKINDAEDEWATEKLRAQRKAEADEQRQRNEADRIAAENQRRMEESEHQEGPPPEMERVPEVKAAPPPPKTQVRPGYGRAAAVKTEWKVTRIVDIDALFVLLKTHPEMITLMTDLAERAKNKAQIDPPGVEMEERAKVR